MSPTSFQWLTLVGVIWVQSVSGTNANFPAYSSHLKHLLSLSDVQLNCLAFASDAGKLLGFLSGIATVYLPLWLVLLIGSTLGFVGYGLQYLFITNQITCFSYAHVFFLTVLAGNSICWINTVCYVVTINNFPSHEQVAIGLTTSYQGLSAKICTVLVDDALFYSPSAEFERAEAYLLLNSVLPLLICVVTASMLRDVSGGESGKRSMNSFGFPIMFSITIATGIYAVIGSFGSMSKGLSPLGNTIGILVLLMLPLVIPVAQWLFGSEEDEEQATTDEEKKADDEEKKADDEEIGVKVMVTRVEFWLYFFVYISGATLGLVYLNNLGQIADSRGCSFATSSLVSLSSSSIFFGRLMPSFLHYCFSRSRYMISGVACIAALMAPMAGAFFLIVNKANISLYTSTAVIGVCTGAITSISVSTTAQLFGTKNFSINHNVVVTSIPIGSFIFGYSAALLYHKERSEDHVKCVGMRCYRYTLIMWGSLCFIGAFLALVLHARLRRLKSSPKAIHHKQMYV